VQYNTANDVSQNGGVVVPSMDPADVFGQILGGIFGGGRNGRRGNGGGGYPRGGGGYPRGGGGYPGGGRNGRSNDYQTADEYLRALADDTGGRRYQADSLQNMSSAFANVAEELRRQYSIGYYPKNPGQPGQRRKVRVRANQPNLAVRSRDSYISNPNGNIVADDKSQAPPILRKLVDPNKPSSRF
jgi:hypothetical protein